MLHVTDRWRLQTPEELPTAQTPSVVVATIHPRGDQRILKCIQSLLTQGCAVHVIWLGADVGERTFDPWLRETVLLEPPTTRDRLKRTVPVYRVARQADAQILYVHDYYMLPHAWLWKRGRRGSRVVFDSHEFYPELYSAKFPAPVRPVARRVLELTSRLLFRCVDGFSLVSERMVTAKVLNGRPVIVTPNYPSSSLFPEVSVPASGERARRVLHSGSLAPSYASDVLVGAAKILEDRGVDVTIDVIERFTSVAHREWFSGEMARHGNPSTLRLIPVRPAGEMQALLQQYGIGLSLIADEGQNALAVPTKVYEYAANGLFVIACDLTMQDEFVRTQPGVTGACFGTGSAESLADVLQRTIEEVAEHEASLAASTPVAQAQYSWEATCTPQFAMFLSLA